MAKSIQKNVMILGIAVQIFSIFPVQATPKLKVGVYVAAPFVMETDSFSVNKIPPKTPPSKSQKPENYSKLKVDFKSVNFQGISIDLWQQIAVLENLDYEYFREQTVEDGIEAVAKGEIDILIGSIPITPEGLHKVSFTQPYYLSAPALLVQNPRLTFWDLVHPFLRLALISSLTGVLILKFIIAHLIWLVERHENSKLFPKDYLTGIREAFWFAAVTMTTVGYGDKVPITPLGKCIAFIWMLISMVIVTTLTAALATNFTLSLSKETVKKLTKPEDLKGTKIAVISGTELTDITKKYQMPTVETKNLDQAINLLLLGQVQGVLYLESALKYYQHQQAAQSFTVVPLHSLPLTYGFAVKKNSPLVEKIDVIILQMQQDNQLADMIHQWTN
ncbi:transporter substrate-binding domain-containing protein [Gloeothece verrucosa]|uniref:Extracellular solute-binding protein family 3 n=1 Tax=Gloeothece verrucosa (strain PCC 7822) TaxID=497965 RepID=E0UK75_GLOV7|nr:transporter substrate-binding domain-containing protein [Gloeothece verrucosa]ADN15837.1 extracellular solute-binding protein family 3 [Gloeothece verrucosa PCC 7822]